ncbi:hypothetical protein RSAG8_11653, partial [Rhizoctonia solani AG-8 WAC10335]
MSNWGISSQVTSGKPKSSNRKQRKWAKAKGKELEHNPTPESDTHPGKKCQVEQLTKDDIAAAPIQTIDQLNRPDIQTGTNHAKWSLEDIFKHVMHWFSDENYIYTKNNQAVMYQQVSPSLI